MYVNFIKASYLFGLWLDTTGLSTVMNALF